MREGREREEEGERERRERERREGGERRGSVSLELWASTGRRARALKGFLRRPGLLLRVRHSTPLLGNLLPHRRTAI